MLGDVHSLKELGKEIVKQVEWIEGNRGHISNPLTAALGVFANAANADPQANLINQLISRVSALEERSEAEAGGTVRWQRDLPTDSLRQLRRFLRVDQTAHNPDWTENEDGTHTAVYCGFQMKIRPQNRGRWSSSATETETGYSVTYPVWQPSADSAKQIISRAVDSVLAERDTN